MISLNMPIELIVSILNTYLRSKYKSLSDLCEYEEFDLDELNDKLLVNNYEYLENINQIKYKN